MLPLILITIVLNFYTVGCVRASYTDWQMLLECGINGSIRFLARESIRHEALRLIKHLISLAIIIDIATPQPRLDLIAAGVIAMDLLIGLNSMLDLRGRRRAIKKEQARPRTA